MNHHANISLQHVISELIYFWLTFSLIIFWMIFHQSQVKIFLLNFKWINSISWSTWRRENTWNTISSLYVTLLFYHKSHYCLINKTIIKLQQNYSWNWSASFFILFFLFNLKFSFRHYLIIKLIIIMCRFLYIYFWNNKKYHDNSIIICKIFFIMTVYFVCSVR